MATRRGTTAIQPYKHDLVIGDLYALQLGATVDKGDALEVSTDPCTFLSLTSGDQKIELVRSRGGDYRDMFMGHALEYVSTTRIVREFKVDCHGPILAKNCSSTNALQPGRKYETAANGGIAHATAWNYTAGRIMERIPPLKYGAVFIYP
jgi:hypothetical protein